MKNITVEIKTAVEDVIRDDLHNEALEILSLGTNDDRQDFMTAYNDDKGNICCLILDYAKKGLVKKGILEQKDTDGFGKFPFEDGEDREDIY